MFIDLGQDHGILRSEYFLILNYDDDNGDDDNDDDDDDDGEGRERGGRERRGRTWREGRKRE